VEGREGPQGSPPSMLDLVRLSPRLLFPPGGVELYRQIALLTEMAPEVEVLDVACGKGVPLFYFVKEFGVRGAGVEPDAELVAEAEERARKEDLADKLQLQQGYPHDLPYRDGVFDVVIGEVGFTAYGDPGAAVRELVRVARPGGQIVVIQLVWKAPVDPVRRRVLSEHLGVRPLMLVELRKLLLEAGVDRLHTEDWSDEETAFRPQIKKPFPDFAELFTLWEKLGILRRAWRRWGWQGVKNVLQREMEVHRLLTRERILGLDLIKGVKAEGPEGGEGVPPVGAPAEEAGAHGGGVDEGGESSPKTGRGEGEESGPDGNEQTAGLPLFGPPEQD